MKEWLDRVTNAANVHAIAREARVPHKTLDTQLRSRTGLKPEMVVKIARAYGASPVASLVELGLITDGEATDAAAITYAFDQKDTVANLRRATDSQILSEVGRRLSERGVVLTDETGEDLS